MIHVSGYASGCGESDVGFDCVMPESVTVRSRDVSLESLRARSAPVNGPLNVTLRVTVDQTRWICATVLKNPFRASATMSTIGSAIKRLPSTRGTRASAAVADGLSCFTYRSARHRGGVWSCEFGVALAPYSRMAVSDYSIPYIFGLAQYLVRGVDEEDAPHVSFRSMLEEHPEEKVKLEALDATLRGYDDDGAGGSGGAAANNSRVLPHRDCYFENNSSNWVQYWAGGATHRTGDRMRDSKFAPQDGWGDTKYEDDDGDGDDDDDDEERHFDPVSSSTPAASFKKKKTTKKKKKKPPPEARKVVEIDVIITHTKLPQVSAQEIVVTRTFGDDMDPADANVVSLAVALEEMLREACAKLGLRPDFLAAHAVGDQRDPSRAVVVIGLGVAYHGAGLRATIEPLDDETRRVTRWPVRLDRLELDQPKVEFTDDPRNLDAWREARLSVGPFTPGESLFGSRRFNPLEATPGLLVLLVEGQSNSTVRGQGHVCVVGRLEDGGGGEIRGVRGTLRGRPPRLTLRFVKPSGKLYEFRDACRIDACLRVLEPMNCDDDEDEADDDPEGAGGARMLDYF